MDHPHRLTRCQCRKVCDALVLGCDRTTACHFAGVTVEELQATIDADESLAREIALAEAKASVRHQGNLHEAAKNEKNWRISAWWLERRDQQRAREESPEPSEQDLREMVQALASVVVEVIPDIELQRKLIKRLYEVLAGNAGATSPPSSRPVPALLLPHFVLDQDATSHSSGGAGP